MNGAKQLVGLILTVSLSACASMEPSGDWKLINQKDKVFFERKYVSATEVNYRVRNTNDIPMCVQLFPTKLTSSKFEGNYVNYGVVKPSTSTIIGRGTGVPGSDWKVEYTYNVTPAIISLKGGYACP